MLSHADNELLCRVGPATPMGDMMRRYWHPVCMSTQLPGPDAAPLRVRLLGEATTPKTRTELRVALRVRNERLGDALERLSTAGAIQRLGDRWIRSAVTVAVPVPIP